MSKKQAAIARIRERLSSRIRCAEEYRDKSIRDAEVICESIIREATEDASLAISGLERKRR